MSVKAESLPVWVEYARALGPLVVAAVIGSLGALIAWRQWQTNRDSFREKLFDRRFEVFEETESLLGRVLRGEKIGVPGEPSLEQSLAEFHSVRRRSKFLFAERIDGRLKEIHELMIDVDHHRSLKQPYAEEQKELMNLYRNLPEVFRVFLAFE